MLTIGVARTERVETGVELERVYRERGDRLWRAVLAYSGDPDVASDAVAEAFAQALRRGGALRDPEAWVWRAAFRLAAGELADRRRRTAALDAPPRSYDLPEPADELIAALARLSPTQRACVVLHHYAGYPVKEIASIVGSTQAAVRVHLSQGRKRLRAVLARSGDGGDV
ncbi:MAG TPA: sigma-70 family RNA polymerase sigma factor [Actinomycetota bacterium]|jgi:RNA polymerase sigma-70 factor (ECF subfamily)